jgi:hypothetical protein
MAYLLSWMTLGWEGTRQAGLKAAEPVSLREVKQVSIREVKLVSLKEVKPDVEWSVYEWTQSFSIMKDVVEERCWWKENVVEEILLCAEVVRFLRRESQQRKELKRESTRSAHSLTQVNHPARFDHSSHVMNLPFTLIGSTASPPIYTHRSGGGNGQRAAGDLQVGISGLLNL